MLPFPPDESCFLYHFPHLLVFSKIVLFEDFQFKHMQRRFYFAGNTAPVDSARPGALRRNGGRAERNFLPPKWDWVPYV